MNGILIGRCLYISGMVIAFGSLAVAEFIDNRIAEGFIAIAILIMTILIPGIGLLQHKEKKDA